MGGACVSVAGNRQPIRIQCRHSQLYMISWHLTLNLDLALTFN